MEQRRVQYTNLVLLFAGVLISTTSFCPSSPQPQKRSFSPPPISFKQLRVNFSEDKEVRKQQTDLAKAVLDCDIGLFNTLIAEGVILNFAFTHTEGVFIPIFSALVSDFYEQAYQKKGTPSPDHTYKQSLLLKLLLKNGANANATNQAGQRPLDLANQDEAKILRKHGARNSKQWQQDEAFFWQYVSAPGPLLTKEDTPLP